MESTSRGLELTRTEQPSDAQRFLQVMKDAAKDAAGELQRDIIYDNPRSLTTRTNQIAAISEIWLWASGISCDYRRTPAVLIAVPKYARHIDEWHEVDGPVLWWRDPIEEPPYVGTPDYEDFDETYKWWSPIDTPEIPESETRE